MNRMTSLLAAGLLAASGMALVGCAQASSGGSSVDLSGSGTYYTAPIHQSGIVVKATVSTNSDGAVTAADIKEYMDLGSWVFTATTASGKSVTVNPTSGKSYTVTGQTVTTYTPVGGEIVRLYMAGKNLDSTTTATNLVGATSTTTTTYPSWAHNYTFFYYNAASKGWVEFAPSTVVKTNVVVFDNTGAVVTTVPSNTTTVAYAAPTTAGSSYDMTTYTAKPLSTTAAATPNLDIKLSSTTYAKAYTDACDAVIADPTPSDLTTAKLISLTATVGTQPTGFSGLLTVDSTMTPVATAATEITWRSAGDAANANALNTDTFVSAASAITTPLTATQLAASGGSLIKANKASTYFPMTATQLGYRSNLANLLTFFTANPSANYAGAVQMSVNTNATGAATTGWILKIPTVASIGGTVTTGANLDVQDVAKTAKVWTVTKDSTGAGTVDGLAGATYSDFPNYGQALQNAYALATRGVTRTLNASN